MKRFLFCRSQAQDEQTSQHGEPGADEAHSRQSECKNCSPVPTVHHRSEMLLLTFAFVAAKLVVIVVCFCAEGPKVEQRHLDQTGQTFLG